MVGSRLPNAGATPRRGNGEKMSAWIVSKHHIDAMLTAALSRRIQGPQRGVLRFWTGDLSWAVTRETADEVGEMLWGENVASVARRYGGDEVANLPGPVELSREPYRFEQLPGEVDPVKVFKIIDCFDYQSCEHEGWKSSPAFAFCQALRKACWQSLPGYDAGPWGVDDREVFVVRRLQIVPGVGLRMGPPPAQRPACPHSAPWVCPEPER